MAWVIIKSIKYLVSVVKKYAWHRYQKFSSLNFAKFPFPIISCKRLCHCLPPDFSIAKEEAYWLGKYSFQLFSENGKLKLALLILNEPRHFSRHFCKHHFIAWHYYFLKITLFVAISYWIYIICKFLLL